MEEIEVELVEKRRTGCVRGDDIEERIAVRGCPHRRLGADIATRTGPVLDDELLTEPFCQPFAHHASDDIRPSAGRIWDDDAHRPRRIGLRPSETRDGRLRGSARCKMQKMTA